MPEGFSDYELNTRPIGFGSRKQCRTCKQWKRRNEFTPSEYALPGLVAGCRTCQKSLGRAYYAIRRDKDRQRDERLRKKFGITLEEYNQKLDNQDGVCAICGEMPTTNRHHVDHCHETHAVRGLLCSRCNNWLGILEQTNFVANAVSYLSHHGPPSLSRLKEIISERGLT